MRTANILLCVYLACLTAAPMQLSFAGAIHAAPSSAQQPAFDSKGEHQDPPASCSADNTTPDDIAYATLLDPDADMLKRQHEFSELESLAKSGNLQALYCAGSLYRAGHILPHALVDRDLTKARLYLSHAAVNGKLEAMRKLAEIELVAKHPVEAMVWAQVFAHYEPLLEKMPPDLADKGPVADLLARTFDAFGSRDIKAVQRDVGAFMQQYDSTISAASKKTLQIQACPDNQMISAGEVQQPAGTNSGAFMDGQAKPGTAEFFLVFKPDGSVTKALPLDAVPDPELLRMLRPIAEQSRVRPSVVPARYALLPVAYTFGEAQVRK